MADSPEPDLEDVDRRIKGFRDEQKPSADGLQGLGLVFGLGFTVVTCLGGGWLGGEWLVKHTGHSWMLGASMVSSFAFTGLAVYRLLKPFLKTS